MITRRKFLRNAAGIFVPAAFGIIRARAQQYNYGPITKFASVASGPTGNVTFDAINGPTESNTGSSTITNTGVVVNSHSNTYLQVIITTENGSLTVTSVTRNGQSFTALDSVTNASEGKMFVYHLVNPTVGTFDVTTVVNTASRTIIACIAYYNVNQSTPNRTVVKNTGLNTSWSQTATSSATSDLVINYDHVAVTTLTEGAGQTVMGSVLNGTWSVGASYKVGTGSNISMGASISSGNRQFLQFTCALQQ